VHKRIKAKVGPRDLAAEIIRRVRASTANSDSPGSLPYVVHLSEPPTAEERLQLAACRLVRQPIVIVPGKCLTVEEWVQRYASRSGVRSQ
jgi:hypothetical protein